MLKETIAFAIALLLSYCFSHFNLSRFFLDHPDGRKRHAHPIPHLGGVAIYLALLVAGGGIDYILVPSLFFILGVVDDFLNMGYKWKLGFQLIISILAILLYDWELTLFEHFLSPWLTYILVIVWLITITNAFNFIDGLNGLAAGVFIVAVLIHSLMNRTLDLLPFVAATMGFLIFNVRGSIFLGDGGSYFLGSMLAMMSLKSPFLNGEGFRMLIFMGYPAYEITYVVVKRLLKRKSPFHPDRLHTHYTLLDRGLPAREVVIILITFSAVCNLLSSLKLSIAMIAYGLAVLYILILVGRFESRSKR